MILISAGHSDKDPGAVAGGVTEEGYAQELRNLISEHLAAMSIPHCMDGRSDVNLPLTEAIKLAKGSDIAVEIHCNASTNPAATGIECISLPPRKAFAQKLAAVASSTLRLRLRGEGGWIDQSKSQHTRLGFVEAGGLILEVVFLSNSLDLAAMQTYKNLLARNIAEVIAHEHR